LLPTFQIVLRLFSSYLLVQGLGPEPEQDPHPDTGLRDPDLLTYKFRTLLVGGTLNVFFSDLVFLARLAEDASQE
jgi:hypothetical protein